MTFPASDPGPALAALGHQLRAGRWHNLAYPGAIDLAQLVAGELAAAGLPRELMNNIGSPYDNGHGHDHSKPQERQVVDLLADLLGAPDSQWGYVTGGSTECSEHALYDARQQLPGLIVYSSIESHYSIAKLCMKLGLPRVVVAADESGRMDLADLREEMGRRRDRPAMVIATAGTTMTEACDDVAGIAELCRKYAPGRYRLHVDAALAGPPLGLLPPDQRPAFDFTAGATSIGLSGHKSLSTIMICGVLIYAEPPYAAARARISYTGTADVTITGSRPGLPPLALFTVLNKLGADGHRQRFDAARELAAYAHGRLCEIGVDARRNPHAFTVYFPPPPPQHAQRWTSASDGRYAHIICMPGVQRNQVDEYVDDWVRLLPVVPGQRNGKQGRGSGRQPALRATS